MATPHTNIDSNLNAPSLARLLRSQLQIGDAILTGCAEPLSWIIRTGSRSRYSHMAVVTGPGRLIEAYDYAMTPNETDEGIYSITLEEFLVRPTRPRLLAVRRPLRIDRDRLVAGARWLEQHSPSFPTVGMAYLALCGLTEPLLRPLPESLRRRVLLHQAALASDGTTRMHCAETATRLYHHAGVPLRFPAPRLERHIQVVGRDHPPSDLATLPAARRTASPGRWPDGRLRAWAFAARSLREVHRERRRDRGAVDPVDLILPGDYARAQPFATVARYRHGSDGWALAA